VSWLLKLTLALLVLILIPVGYVFYQASLSPNDWIYEGGGVWRDGGAHGAPGPLLGAGLPLLMIGGAGYWVVRRFRRKPE
jgi:hypothetical protein